MLTYKKRTQVHVYLDNKYVGSIVDVKGGYQYLPKRSSQRGDIFPTIQEVKDSL